MTNFEKVKAFQRAFNLPVLERLTIPADRVELRMSLIAEEMVELREAIEAGDVVAVADALGDLAYVTYGMAAECGIDLDACFAEIHRSNMAKLGADGKPIINDGVMRPDLPVGKVLKPKDWQAPDLREVLFGSSQSCPSSAPSGRPEAPLSAGWEPTHRHVKRGTVYRLVSDAVLQTEAPVSDGNEPALTAGPCDCGEGE